MIRYRVEFKARMRDGDGDGLCREGRGGRGIPCPPGTPTGKPSNLSNAAKPSKPRSQRSEPKLDALDVSNEPIADDVGPLDKHLAKLISERRQRAAVKAAEIIERAKSFRSKAQVAAAKKWDRSKFEPLDLDDWLDTWTVKNPEPDPADFADDDSFADAISEWRSSMMSEYADHEDAAAFEAMEVLREIFDGPLVGKNGEVFTVDMDSVERDEIYGGLAINGTIRDATGAQVGGFSRTFHDDGPDGPEVHHDHLVIEAAQRDAGIASAFNARNEGLYRAMGYQRISVAGASSKDGYTGATHWPRNGYDWADEDERDGFHAVIEDALDEYDELTSISGGRAPMITRPNGDVALFSSPQERAMVEEMLEISKEMDFDDPNRLTAADLLHWTGSTEWFQQRGSGSVSFNYVRRL